MTRAQKRMVLLMLDIGLVPFAFLFSSIVQYSTISPGRFLFANWPIVPILMVVAVVLSLALRTADTRLKHYDVAAAQRTALFAAILAIVSALLTKLGQMSIPAGFHVNFGLVYLVLCAGSRIILLQTLLAIYRDSEAVTRVIIYGAGQTGMSLATALRARPDILPIAFVDDNPSMRGLILAGLPVFSGAHVDRILEQHR
ncbi:MAG: polysaccharide biosynthesis protein, partial [Albidovulum sp.]